MKALPFLFLLLLATPLALAAIDFSTPPTAQEQQQFDAILKPVMKIYNFVKYAATVIGVLMMVFAGVSFVTAGGDQQQKEKAKSTATYVIIGLIVIWIAPLVVNFVFS